MNNLVKHSNCDRAEIEFKVAIIEDLRDIREGLATMINFTEGFECVGKYNSMEEAIASIGHRTPDIVLSDIELPEMDGIESSAKHLRKTTGSLKKRSRCKSFAPAIN